MAEGEPPKDIEQGRPKSQLAGSAEFFLEQSFAFKKQAVENAREYGLYCLRLLAIAHGGAIAALLGFFGSARADALLVAKMKWPFVAFAFGFVLIIGSSFCAYVNWMMHSHNRLYPEEAHSWLKFGKVDKEYFTKGLGWSNGLAIGFGITSAVVFFVGSILVVLAL